jgi:hypothetical protein
MMVLNCSRTTMTMLVTATEAFIPKSPASSSKVPLPALFGKLQSGALTFGRCHQSGNVFRVVSRRVVGKSRSADSCKVPAHSTTDNTSTDFKASIFTSCFTSSLRTVDTVSVSVHHDIVLSFSTIAYQHADEKWNPRDVRRRRHSSSTATQGLRYFNPAPVTFHLPISLRAERKPWRNRTSAIHECSTPFTS